MANHFTQFSFIIPLEVEEVGWVQQVLSDADDVENVDETLLGELRAMDSPVREFFDHLCETMCFHHTNNWELHKMLDGPHVWIHGDEGCDLEGAALFAKAYLKRFHPQQAIEFTWCEFCDKPRAGSFSGGGCLVTTNEVKMENAYDIVERFKKESGRKVRNTHD